MAITHTITTQYITDAGQVISAQNSVSDIDAFSFDGTIPATSTNQVIPLAFDFANMASFLLYSDQNVSLYTNATGGVGGNTFTLMAGIPQTWNKNNGLANPFTANVTTFYGDNAGATVANVKIRVLGH